MGARITTGSAQVMMLSNAGKAIRFEETDVRAMGRTAPWCQRDEAAGRSAGNLLIIPEDNAQILTAVRKVTASVPRLMISVLPAGVSGRYLDAMH